MNLILGEERNWRWIKKSPLADSMQVGHQTSSYIYTSCSMGHFTDGTLFSRFWGLLSIVNMTAQDTTTSPFKVSLKFDDPRGVKLNLDGMVLITWFKNNESELHKK
jgi:hypothetical protein